MTDIDTLKRAAQLLRDVTPGGDGWEYAAALESLAERMGHEPVAWQHHYRKITGGRSYVQADCGGPDIHPDPDEGYEWLRATPLYAAPQPTPEDEARLDWFEDRHTLHYSLEVTYVVDGYEVQLLVDGEPGGKPIHGKTLRAAIDAAMQQEQAK